MGAISEWDASMFWGSREWTVSMLNNSREYRGMMDTFHARNAMNRANGNFSGSDEGLISIIVEKLFGFNAINAYDCSLDEYTKSTEEKEEYLLSYLSNKKMQLFINILKLANNEVYRLKKNKIEFSEEFYDKMATLKTKQEKREFLNNNLPKRMLTPIIRFINASTYDNLNDIIEELTGYTPRKYKEQKQGEAKINIKSC